MQRCLQLALSGAGTVAPNPMVGAVLVHNGSIIGEGYHQLFGKAHAEVNCIKSVHEQNKALIPKSTLYVSLEPCSHFGKTPPCADLIVTQKIPRVVIGCSDSYKEVAGKGIAKLLAAGIEVITGILEAEAKEINKRFFTFHQLARPYIILKWAQSSDHKIANANFSRLMISGDITNRLVHKWRSEEAAIMIGTNTALHDNPTLNTRLWPGKNPIRVVIDKNLQLPASSNLLLPTKGSTIIFNHKKNEETDGIIYKKIHTSQAVLPQILQQLYLQNINSVLVEGGTKLLQSFIDAGFWDEARIITNEQLFIDDGIAAPVLKNAALIKTAKPGTDLIQYFKPLPTNLSH